MSKCWSCLVIILNCSKQNLQQKVLYTFELIQQYSINFNVASSIAILQIGLCSVLKH